MASLGQTFNAAHHDTEQRDYENLPNGIYRLEVEKSDVAPTSNGNGTILKLGYNVIEPEQFKDRKIFGNINLANQNEKAQEIGQREFASLCRATGLAEVADSEQLHFIGFTAKVGLSKQRTGNDGKVYEPRNEIKRFYFPDAGDAPPIGVDAAPPRPANDNRPAPRPAANDNRRPAAPAPARAAGAKPWPQAQRPAAPANEMNDDVPF